MNIWVVRDPDGRLTAWSTQEKAREALQRQILAGQREHLESALADLPRLRAWVDWLTFKTTERPDMKVWETRLLKGGDPTPQEREEFLKVIQTRVRQEIQRIAAFRRRIRNIEAGHDYSAEFGASIEVWTLDTDEPQNEVSFD